MSAYTTAQAWYGPQGDDYVVLLPLTWDVGRVGSGLTITVPEGFTFDVSVPWYLRWAANPRRPEYHKAACLHDYCLHELQWDRITAGAVFHAGLKADGVGLIRRIAMTLAVMLVRWR